VIADADKSTAATDPSVIVDPLTDPSASSDACIFLNAILYSGFRILGLQGLANSHEA
jgi:hypothetical protein